MDTERWIWTRHPEGSVSWSWRNDAGIIVPADIDFDRSVRGPTGGLIERAWVARDDGLEHVFVELLADPAPAPPPPEPAPVVPKPAPRPRPLADPVRAVRAPVEPLVKPGLPVWLVGVAAAGWALALGELIARLG